MEGELDFKQALKERVACLEGQPETIIRRTLEHLSLNPGVESLTAFSP